MHSIVLEFDHLREIRDAKGGFATPLPAEAWTVLAYAPRDVPRQIIHDLDILTFIGRYKGIHIKQSLPYLILLITA